MLDKPSSNAGVGNVASTSDLSAGEDVDDRNAAGTGFKFLFVLKFLVDLLFFKFLFFLPNCTDDRLGFDFGFGNADALLMDALIFADSGRDDLLPAAAPDFRLDDILPFILCVDARDAFAFDVFGCSRCKRIN